ncbi:AraC family transcriptional regulator [Roseibacillus persicicus]|uniref:AraC family transcriptional regulator n=1 Tax=Roseibacillus persicicus TaxID=454148 RepID=UPI00280C5514|nr:DNA-binding transcriptional regulator [Roseibacillus persicicus]MDQ8192343.1 DNA-binding transcriptional regulator [Roseibacillus persicicus]
MRKTTPYRIAILYPTSVPWMARCLDGIRQFAKQHGDWHLFTTPPAIHGVGEGAVSLTSLKGWHGHGIILASNNTNELTRARRMKIPVINLAGGLESGHGVPRVMVDHHAAGRLAAEHLISRGLTNLAFFGWENLAYSEKRQHGFVERAAESGLECEVMLREADKEKDLSWTRRIAEPTRWLSSLPKPCGVFAVHDFRAQLLMEACQEIDLLIPEDIALVGMDNDDIICEHSIPTLTSISRSSVEVGYRTAALLDQLIQGIEPTEQEILVPPAKVYARQSTDMHYCSDELVAQAIAYMTNRLNRDFGISDVADAVNVSRRKLEMRFASALGSSPRSYLTKLRVQRAQALLELDPKRTIQSLVGDCGFRSRQTFYESFKRVVGHSPERPEKGEFISPEDS